MKAAACAAYGGPEVVSIVEMPVPVPREDEVLIRIDGQAAEAVDLLGQRLTETRGAPGDGILVMRPPGGALQGGEELFGRGEVRKALGEVDRPVLVRQTGHPADDGLGETGEAAGGRRHDQTLGSRDSFRQSREESDRKPDLKGYSGTVDR